MIETIKVPAVYAAGRGHAAQIVTEVIHQDRPSAEVVPLTITRTPAGRYTVTVKVTWTRSTVHTSRGKVIGPEGLPYGTTHDMDCPGCEGTPFTASPRSEAYWSS